MKYQVSRDLMMTCEKQGKGDPLELVSRYQSHGDLGGSYQPLRYRHQESSLFEKRED